MNVLCLNPFSEEEKTELKKLEGIEIAFSSYGEDLSPYYAETEVILGNPSPALLPNFKKLKWLQLESAGNEKYLIIPKHIQLTNASGVYGIAISEYMLAALLSSEKRLLEYDELQKKHQYTDLGLMNTVYNSTIVCLGLGDIGTNFAKRVKAMGAHVIAVTRNLHECSSYIDEAYTVEDLQEVLPRADVLACALPHTDKTEGLLNYEMLTKCRKDCILINVGRGSLIEEDGLLQAMEEGYFSSVYLDVQRDEPLKADSKLYDKERLHITPHISGKKNAIITRQLLFQIMKENLIRYRDDLPLDNVVDRTAGY